MKWPTLRFRNNAEADVPETLCDAATPGHSTLALVSGLGTVRGPNLGLAVAVSTLAITEVHHSDT